MHRATPIRQVSAHGLPALARYSVERPSAPTTRCRLRMARSARARAVAWVAEVQSVSSAAGFATANPVFSTWQGEDYLHLDGLYLRLGATAAVKQRFMFSATYPVTSQWRLPCHKRCT